jgi:hypothetical protein
LLNLLQSQLAFFGVIDEAVLYAQRGGGENPEAVLSTVKALLPGTTGFGQAGWYHELEEFANRPGVRVSDSRITFPTVPQAISYLQLPNGDARMGLARDFPGPGEPAALLERTGNYDALHDPVFARSAYAAMVLARIDGLGGIPPNREVPLDLPAQIMAAAVNYWRGSPGHFDASQPRSDLTVQNLLSQVDRIDSRESWHRLAAQEVDLKFADQSLPCFGTLVEVDGEYVSTLYTNATDADLTVNEIVKIVDPRNWSLCCKFFCEVSAQVEPYDPRGWSRILERIGPECQEWCLRTALLFYYGSDRRGGIFINYELDPHRQNDSGVVEVDNGYIWITPLNGNDPSAKGVRIRTSKQERVQGLSPTATSALGCLLGWADAAYELVGGTARLVLDGKVPSAHLEHFEITPTPDYELHMDPGIPVPAGAGSRTTLPPNFGSTVDDVRGLLNDLINRTRDVGADAATRWLDGMSRDDVREITDSIGRNLREFALDVYQTAENNVKPKADDE